MQTVVILSKSLPWLTPSAKNLSWVIVTSLESHFWRNKEHSKLITFLYLFLPKIVPRSKFAESTFLIISAPKFCVKSNNILLFIFFYLSKPFLPRPTLSYHKEKILSDHPWDLGQWHQPQASNWRKTNWPRGPLKEIHSNNIINNPNWQNIIYTRYLYFQCSGWNSVA